MRHAGHREVPRRHGGPERLGEGLDQLQSRRLGPCDTVTVWHYPGTLGVIWVATIIGKHALRITRYHPMTLDLTLSSPVHPASSPKTLVSTLAGVFAFMTGHSNSGVLGAKAPAR